MIIELDRFVEFTNGWFAPGTESKSRTNMVFERMTINTDYVAWLRRHTVTGIEMSEIHMADRGGNWVVDKPYETMRDVLFSARKA